VIRTRWTLLVKFLSFIEFDSSFSVGLVNCLSEVRWLTL
jgi:hypothetical protein